MSNNTSRSNTLQIFRSAHSAYDAPTDPTGLNYGELAWNNGLARLWIGRQTSTGTPGTITPYLLNPAASDTVVGLVELATDAEAITGTDATRAVTPDNLGAWTGNTTITSVGEIGTGVWSGDALVAGKVPALDAITAPANDVAFNGKKITGLADPADAQDGCTKAYADGLAQGLTIIDPCYHATAAALPACTYANGTLGVGATLTADGNGALTIDGTGASAGKRVLVKDQAAQLQNGIYTVTTVGNSSPGAAFVLTRATDYDKQGELLDGDFCFIQVGVANANRGFVQTAAYWTASTGTMGTHAITWVQFSGAGQITDGFALLKTGDTLDVQTGNTNATVCIGNDARLSDDRKCDDTFNDAATSRTALGLGTSAVLDTAAIADGGSGVATADQIDTFVKSFNYSTTVGDVTLTGTQTLTNKTIDCGTFIATS